ncbi:type I-D CRISPR-associated helicase Cas3' [Roseofilum capinflatum]|uniref:Type I-D CRISPR-associated helicase Cas3 n=1 Tax=Roseofilum capinflatum BLCC-M114 TaxID=3022440 RepID=A0ABT7B435_9CYAN|nr:type I-D CRISPR-associated helicase Cas3' [Roseofilum capinflatum]MDJ1173359.1 type I-D CRISPR-associated helicase Cas3' [Roseofilum capinflatum BLCC-M114]
MNEYSITLKSVYSCPATESSDKIKLPENWRLSWHQLETWKALQNPDINVVFNTAMTGDGKSLAAYLSSLQSKEYCIALYPTNELARDQEKQVQDYIATFQPRNDPRVVRLSGADLEIYAEEEGLKKAGAIATRIGQSDIILTNPDIFHYLHRGAYLTPKDSPDQLWQRLDKNFDLFIFDEFHVFAAPQIASVINTLLLIRCTNRRKKFLFLSATPNKELKERLEQAEFRCCEINPIAENKYQFPDTPEQAQALSGEGWRRVTGEILLNFIPLESSGNSSETWLKENRELILRQFQDKPGSKGAIILNSIAAVKRLTPFFKTLLSPYGFEVGENTGLSGKEVKSQSLSADLVIGTSTIDVGVDFKINFLFFEAADGGNFIQRLGRLGRHEGYDKDGNSIRFDGFTAYALVPQFLVERLFSGETAPLETGMCCDRPFFHQQITDNYRQINDFRGYYARWGAVQSMVLCSKLKHKTIRSVYKDSAEVFETTAERIFKARLKTMFGVSKRWEKEWQELSGNTTGNPILEDAASFRGSSSLQYGLYDLTEAHEADRFKTYELPGILANLEVEVMTEKAFMYLLRETGDRLNTVIPKGQFRHCLGFMKLHAYREERLNWRFTYPGDLQPVADAWKVQVLVGLEVWQPENPWIDGINQRLKRQGLVSYVLRFPVGEVRSRLRLPMHFQIYPISDANSLLDPSAPYSIAFGQSALLIDTLAYTLKSKGDELWIA